VQKKIVVFSGAGISAESGIRTFRDSGGLWENYDINEVATPEGWKKNFKLVLDFYNQRRKQVMEALPNEAHLALVELEKSFDVHIITQNIDDLHERAGSKNILHLHGEIRKSQSSLDSSLVYDIEGWELLPGQKCEKGAQLRPHVVWFGEAVPAMEDAASIVSQADILIIIGTSLQVYPAASLIYYAQPGTKYFVIGPEAASVEGLKDVTIIREMAKKGVKILVEELIKNI
jgi:NAD-dependent deacetylase